MKSVATGARPAMSVGGDAGAEAEFEETLGKGGPAMQRVL